MIKQTAEIFEILSKGGFISSDSTNPNIRQLYTVIEDNQSELYDCHQLRARKRKRILLFFPSRE